MSDFCNLSLTKLKKMLTTKEVSALEITKAYLNKIHQHNELNCFITVCDDVAVEHAKIADLSIQQGKANPLTGLPIAIKDMIVTKGIKTTCGSKILENFIPPYQSTCVDKLLTQGMVVLGKTNLDEFAMGSSNENSAFGCVRNPWDLDRVPGGSSGGSAAAVAARLAPCALGTDTGGSIRQPASFCGIVGLKPTYGRVSRYGAVAFASSLDQIGPFATSVADCALLAKGLFGHDPKDGTSIDRQQLCFSEEYRDDISGVRIGIPKEYFVDGLHSDVSRAITAAIKHLESMGATIKEISLPHTNAAISTYYILAPAEASSNLSRFDGIRYGFRSANHNSLDELYLNTRSEGFGAEVKRRIIIGTYVLSSGYYDAYYLKAQKVRALIAQDFRCAYDKHCDVILAPTAPTTAFKIAEKTSNPLEMYLNDIFTIPASLAGLPAISIPCGFCSKNLPIGLQLIGKPWDEDLLFSLAHAYEKSTEWHNKMPATFT